MSTATPITQRDVAHACGVHPSTICLALGNSPSIPLPTRQRIQAMAIKLGYQPNAAARNLAFMRADKKESMHLPIAWINQEPEKGFWRTHPQARLHFDGARRRAGELGYYLEEFWVHEPGMRLARLIQIIRARGVQGVLFPVGRTLDASLFQSAWAEFSAVSFNDHRAAHWLDVVCPDYYHNIDMTLRRLKALGFQRIGLALSTAVDGATDGLACCRYLRFQGEQAPEDRVPVCVLADTADKRAAEVTDWHRAYRPDAIVAHDADLGDWATLMGDDPLVVPWGASATGPSTGVDEHGAEVAATAVDCLAEKIRRFERGLGGNTRCYLIKGAWREALGLERRLQAVA